jgi:DNA end-binding protein Ku
LFNSILEVDLFRVPFRSDALPHAIWSGSITFGLVSIPVKSFGAVSEHKVGLRLLCPRDKSPIQYKRICTKDKKEVPWKSILRGYEVDKGKYVALSNKDLEKIEIESGKSVELLRFIDLEKLDPIYFDKAYFLVPTEESKKPYFLLMEALQGNNKVAIGRVVMHEREHLVALRPYENSILMETLHYADEIRDPKDFPELRKPVNVTEEELELAGELIRIMKKPFNLKEYQDRYHESLKQLVQAKIKGKEEVVEPKVPEVEATKDLMQALKASIKVRSRS